MSEKTLNSSYVGIGTGTAKQCALCIVHIEQARDGQAKERRKETNIVHPITIA